jgi:hypothetical protein
MGTPYDLGGTDLITESIRVGATGPGQSGTALSGSELTVLDGVTAGTAAASKAVVTDSNVDVAGLNVVGLARIDLDSATATLSTHAATITKWSAQITSEALTTAAGASQAFVITKTGVAATDLAFVTPAGGTNTREHIQYKAICTSNTVTVTISNIGPTNALNGTVIFNLMICKA